MEVKLQIFLVAIISDLLTTETYGAEHGEACNDEGVQCNDGLHCIYKTCSCLTGEGFEWDAVNRRCVGRVGTSCGSNLNCIENSSCVDMFCKCNSGFSRRRNGHCGAIEGEKCTSSADCNQDALLACNNQKICRCSNDTYQLYQNGFCGSLVGEPCDPYQDYFGLPNGPTQHKCVDGMLCQKRESLSICSCPSGMNVMDNKTCGQPSGSSRWEVTLLCFLPFIIYTIVF